jgi:hypothetical protein
VQGPAGQDLTGVLARAEVGADGTNLTAPNTLTSSTREVTGKYHLTFQLPAAFNSSGLDLFDFPSIVTPQAVQLIPGGPAEILATAVEPLSFNSTTNVLELRVHIRQVPSLNYWDAGFSIVVLQP